VFTARYELSPFVKHYVSSLNGKDTVFPLLKQVQYKTTFKC
jgi:hypothetical protein